MVARKDPSSVASDTPVVTVFRSRLREESADRYHRLAGEMEALARTMPGFVEFKTYEAPDGERVSIIVFASMQAHRAWRDHPRHRRAQELGRRLLYSSYRITVCEQLHEWTHRTGGAGPGRGPPGPPGGGEN